MSTRVLFFAAARDWAGVDEWSGDLPAGSRVSDVARLLSKQYPKLGPLLGVSRIAVNGEYANPDAVVHDGDELAVIPPVSGGSQDGAGPGARHDAASDGGGDSVACGTGAGEVLLAELTTAPIDMAKLAAAVSSHACGAALTFAGSVRAEHRGRAVKRILYDAYGAMALEQIRRIASEAAARHGARVAVQHRTGMLELGEISIGIAVGAAHRKKGFDALREIIEAVKRDVPIWKKEEFADGPAEWVNCSVEARTDDRP